MATTEQPSTEETEQTELYRLPASSGTPSLVTLNKPKGGQQRKSAVRILLPRDPEKLEALPESIRGALAKIIDRVADSPGVDHIEVLMYNGPFGLEIVLHPTPSTIDERGMQTTLPDFENQLHSPVVNRTAEAAEKILPATVGIEIGWLDLTPIGITDVTTIRLLAKHNSTITASGKYSGSPLGNLFAACQRGEIPFLYAVILEKNRHKNRYDMVVRLAPYRPAYNYTGEKGFAKLLENGHPLDLRKPFSPLNVVSNVDGFAKKYWKVTYNERVDGGVEYSLDYDYRYANRYTKKAEIKRRANKLKELTLGKTEHQNLLWGNATWDAAYEQHGNRYGRFNITPAQIKPFVEMVPIQFATNPWPTIKGRSPPVFHTTDPVRRVGAPVQGIGEGTLYVPENISDLSNEGSLDHQSLGQFTRTWFTEQGDLIKKVKQTSDSVPDDVLLTDDGYVVALDMQLECDNDEVTVETESKNSSKPSNTLVNVERAIERGQHVILVYKGKAVERGYSHIAQTFKKYTDNGAHLYNRTDQVRCPDGRIPIYRSSENVEWYANGKTLDARVGETLIASGDIDADVGTFEFGSDDLDVFYYVEDDNRYCIETADGETIVDWSPKGSLDPTWTRVRLPHVPMDVSYLSHVTLMYYDSETEELKRYSETPDFDTEDLDIELDHQSGKRDWYKAGIHTCCNTHLVEQEGRKIPYDELLERVGTWFGERSTLGKPHNSEIGRALPEEIKDAKKGGADNRNPYIDGYAWRFELGVESPHRPEATDYELVEDDN